MWEKGRGSSLGKPLMYLRVLHWCLSFTGPTHVRAHIEDDYPGAGGGLDYTG